MLNKGLKYKESEHDLDWYFERLDSYAKSVKLFLNNFSEHQKKISKLIRTIGGSGRTHGCIVDIDFFNHVYINPIDGSITPYSATSIVDKDIYKNVGSLIKYKIPRLYENYSNLLSSTKGERSIILAETLIDPSFQKNTSTKMYRISNILKRLQTTAEFNVVRAWYENIDDNSLKEVGLLIFKNLIEDKKD